MRTLCCFASLMIFLSSVLAVAAESNHLTENQWVQPTENGTLTGRIVLPAEEGGVTAVKDAAVAIVDHEGKILRGDAKTDAAGSFVIRGVQPGVYALTARADFVFACCAMHVLDAEIELDREFPIEAEISAANIDYTTVNTAIIRYMPPKTKRTDFSMDDADLRSLAPRVRTNDHFRVAQVGAGMKGRLHPPGAEGAELPAAQLTNVFIMKNGSEVARTVTNERGEFSIETLSPGQYSLMAIGPDGLGLIGFELVSEIATTGEVSTPRTSDGKRLVTRMMDGCCQEFSMQVAPPEVVSICDPIVIAEQPVEICECGQPIDQCECGVPLDPCGCEPLPCGGGGFGGGGYGGYGGGAGGGGGIGGGLGGIAGLAGLAAAIAAASSGSGSGSGIIVPPLPATPSVPASGFPVTP